MTSFSLDLTTPLNQGFVYAAALILALGGLLGIKLGFGMFHWVFKMIGGVLEGLN